MAAHTKTTPTTPRRTPSVREMESALQVLEAAKAAEERRKKKQRWTSEGIPGKVWTKIARPQRGGLRDLYRHVLTPWYWGLPAAGAITVQEALVATNDLAGPASLGIVTAGALATANTVPAWLRTKKAAKKHKHAAHWAQIEPGHTRLVANVGAAGAVAAHAVGLTVGWTPDTMAALALASLGVFTTAASRYWQWHRRNTVVLNPKAKRTASTSDQADTGVADPDEMVRRLHQRWPKYVAAANKALPGTELTDIERTDYGATATLHLAPGTQERATVTAALGRIASGLKLSASALAVEDIEPEPGQEPDSSILRLRVVSQATSQRPVPLNDGKPRLVRRGSDWLVRLGEYIDGQGEPAWKLYDKDSMWGGFFAGKTGAGKTTLIETLVIGAFETECTFVIYLKPKKGPSPRIAKHAHWAVEADPASRSSVIDGVVSLMEVRGLINELNDTSEFSPRRDWPGVLVVIDEFHEASAQIEARGKGRLNRIAREGRAVGVALVGASQGFGLEGFCQDDMIRSNMTATNAVSMKLAATQAGIFKREMAMPVNPGDLPDPQKHDRNKGLAFSLLGRPIPFRVAWSPQGETEQLMAAARARAVAGLDADAEAALDKGSRGAYSARDDRKAARKDQVRAMLAEMRGRSGDGADQAARAGEAAAARTAAGEAGRPVPPTLPRQVVVDIAEARKVSTAKAEKAVRPRRSPAIEGVIEVLQQQGPKGTTAIRQALSGREGCGKEAVDRALKTLSEEGVVAKAGDSRKAPWKLV